MARAWAKRRQLSLSGGGTAWARQWRLLPPRAGLPQLGVLRRGKGFWRRRSRGRRAQSSLTTRGRSRLATVCPRAPLPSSRRIYSGSTPAASYGRRICFGSSQAAYLEGGARRPPPPTFDRRICSRRQGDMRGRQLPSPLHPHRPSPYSHATSFTPASRFPAGSAPPTELGLSEGTQRQNPGLRACASQLPGQNARGEPHSAGRCTFLQHRFLLSPKLICVV